MVRRIAILALATAMFGSVLAGPALADHTHVRVLGNGLCVILAAEGGEKYVELPNVDEDLPANRRHPLHTNVHLGQPGEVGAIYVFGSPEGDEACSAGYVNAP